MASNTITTALVLNTTAFRKGVTRAAKQLDRLKAVAGTMGRTLQYALGGALIAAGANAAKAAVDFDLAIAKIKALSGPDSAAGVERLALTARELGKNSIYTAAQVATMQLSLKKLGLEVKTIDDMSEAVLKFATAMDVDVNLAGETVVGTMKKFTNSFTDLNTAQEKSAAITEQFAAATVKSGLTFDTLSNALNYAGAEANSAGFTFAETAAILGKLADAGFRGSRGGVILRKILQSIGKSTSEVREGFTGLIDSNLEFNEIMKIVGVRAAGGTLALGGLGDEIAGLTREIESSTGQVDIFADAVGGSFYGRLREIVSATEEVGIALLDNFEQPIKQAISRLAEFIRSIDSVDLKRFGESIKTVGKIVAGSYLLAAIAKLLIVLEKFWGVIKLLSAPSLWASIAAGIARFANVVTKIGGPVVAAFGFMVGGIKSFIDKSTRAREEIKRFEDSGKGMSDTVKDQNRALYELNKLKPEEIYRRLANGAYEAQMAWVRGESAATADIIANTFIPEGTLKEIENRIDEMMNSGFGFTFEQALSFAISKLKPKAEELKNVVGDIVDPELVRPQDLEMIRRLFLGNLVDPLQRIDESAAKTRTSVVLLADGYFQLSSKAAEAAKDMQGLNYYANEQGEVMTSATQQMQGLINELTSEKITVYAQELLNAFMAIGDIIGSSFSQAINGTKRLGEAIRDNLLGALGALVGKLLALSAAYGLAAIAKALFDGGTSIGAGAAAITASGFGNFLTSGIGVGNVVRSTESNNRTVGYIAGSDLVLTTGRGISANDRLYG